MKDIPGLVPHKVEHGNIAFRIPGSDCVQKRQQECEPKACVRLQGDRIYGMDLLVSSFVDAV